MSQSSNTHFLRMYEKYSPNLAYVYKKFTRVRRRNKSRE